MLVDDGLIANLAGQGWSPLEVALTLLEFHDEA